MSLKIKTSSHEILKGKFADTIAKIEGVYKEAKGDLETNTKYSANAVFGRVENIKNAFYKDLENLSKDIETE